MNIRKLIGCFLVIGCVMTATACGVAENQNETANVQEVEPGQSDVVTIPETTAEALGVEETKKSDVEAAWDGYPEMVFEEYLKKGLTGMFSDGSDTKLKKLEIVKLKGWDAEGLLDEGELAEGSSAVSYVADMIVDSEDGELKRGIKFYMELNGDATLKALKGETFDAGVEYGEILDESDVKALLDELKKYM